MGAGESKHTNVLGQRDGPCVSDNSRTLPQNKDMMEKLMQMNSEEAGGGQSTHRGSRREPGLEVQRGTLTCVFNSEIILFRFVNGEQKKQLRGQQCEGVGHSSPVERESWVDENFCKK